MEYGRMNKKTSGGKKNSVTQFYLSPLDQEHPWSLCMV